VAEFGHELGAQLVNAHGGEAHLLSVALAARGLRVPILRTRSEPYPPRAHAANRWVYERRTAFVIAAAQWLAEGVARTFRRLAAGRIRVVRPGLDVRSYRSEELERSGRALRQELGIPIEAPAIGLLARLSPIKGHGIALRALSILSQTGSTRSTPPYLLLAGPDAEIEPAEILSLAGSLGVAQLVRRVPFQKDVRPLLAACDLGVVPSLGSEGISRAALEFLAAGRPVIASRVGSLPEIVRHGETGLLVPPGDPKALATALGRAVRDAQERARWGEMAWKSALADFNLESFAERTENVFHLVRNLKPPAP